MEAGRHTLRCTEMRSPVVSSLCNSIYLSRTQNISWPICLLQMGTSLVPRFLNTPLLSIYVLGILGGQLQAFLSERYDGSYKKLNFSL